MVWSANRTWITAELVSASIMNTFVRDQLEETAPAKATASSGFIVTDGANSVVQRTPGQAASLGSANLTSTSYTTLAPTPAVNTIQTGTKAIVGWSAGMSNSTAGASTYLSFLISGATTASAADSIAVVYESGAANDFAQMANVQLYEGLTAGSNTFTLQHRVTAGTGTYVNRRIMVVPL